MMERNKRLIDLTEQELYESIYAIIKDTIRNIIPSGDPLREFADGINTIGE